MKLCLYRALTAAGSPLIRLYLGYRRLKGKEDATRFAERLGRPGADRPAGSLVWAHGASVGEALSMLPLVRRLTEGDPGVNVLMTTGTVTSARLIEKRLPPGAFHQYVPVDLRRYVERFLDHWRPDLVLWAESDFWPNLVSLPPSRGIPMVLINGRVSSRSFARWQRHKDMISRLLSGFTLCLGQTVEDAGRLRTLGAADARYVGNLKFAAPPLPADGSELAALEAAAGGRPHWVAASTHAGEEDIIGDVHKQVAARLSGLLTLVAPRQPRRGNAVAAGFRKAGLTVAQRSKNEPITPSTDIYVADTLGELGLFFRLSGVVFVGKSLLPLGGQNPLEPARLDCAVAFGPHMSNFEEMSERMKQSGAAREVADPGALARWVETLLSDKEEKSAAAARAKAFAAAEAGVLDAVMAELEPFLALLGKQGNSRAGA